MSRVVIFGLGYSGKAIASALAEGGWFHVYSTGRDGNLRFYDDEGVQDALREASHVLSTVPPEGSDPVLARYGDFIHDQWLGYLSSTGVYGDTDGAWVDESAPVGGGRRVARAEADACWLERDARVFRLPGIYGPDRSAIERVREGTAHRIDMPGQVFSRVHVEDIASGIAAAIATDLPPGAYNLADDEPASQNEVVEHACRLLGLAPPPLQSLVEANLSSAARAFYTENRRVANGRLKRETGWSPRYPSYREGLASLF